MTGPNPKIGERQRELYGDDYHRRIGALGGKKSGSWMSSDPAKAREYSAKGNAMKRWLKEGNKREDFPDDWENIAWLVVPSKRTLAKLNRRAE